MIMYKALLIFIIIMMLAIPTSASMSKLYVGDENGQAIFGIETTVSNYDGAIGGELRSYIAKKGIIVNGVEYGSLPGRTMYNMHICGKSEGAMIRYDTNTFINYMASKDEVPVYYNSSIALRGGTSQYLFYE